MSLMSAARDGERVRRRRASSRARRAKGARARGPRTAKPARLALLRVVQPARPVDGHVRRAVVQPHGAVDGRARVRLAEAKEVVKDGAVGELAAIDCVIKRHGACVGERARARARMRVRLSPRARTLLHLALKGLDRLGRHAAQKVNVVVAVKGRHLLGRCNVRALERVREGGRRKVSARLRAGARARRRASRDARSIPSCGTARSLKSSGVRALSGSASSGGPAHSNCREVRREAAACVRARNVEARHALVADALLIIVGDAVRRHLRRFARILRVSKLWTPPRERVRERARARAAGGRRARLRGDPLQPRRPGRGRKWRW